MDEAKSVTKVTMTRKSTQEKHKKNNMKQNSNKVGNKKICK